MYSNSVSDALQALVRAISCLMVLSDTPLSKQELRAIQRLIHRLELEAEFNS